MGYRWYVVQTKHNQEFIAEQNLRNQEFHTFLPLYQEVVQVKRKKNKIQDRRLVVPRVLYPSYMFVRFDIEQDKWRSVNGTRGIVRLLCATEENAYPVPKGFVEELIARCNSKGYIDPDIADNVLEKYAPGTLVEIKANSFNGLVGKCLEIKNKKMTVLFTLLSRQVQLELPLKLVAPLKTSNPIGGSVDT